MTSLQQPPVFNPDGGDSYVDWRNDIEVWCMLTEGKVKHGPAVFLSLNGDARDAVRHIAKEELSGKDGVDKLLSELDKIYLKDGTTRAFNAIKSFVQFRRESTQPFSKFLIEFNHKYREIKKHNLNFDDGILAFFLLTAANLTEDHERLVRATAKLTFEDVKDKLQKVFGEFDSPDGQMHEAKLPVKEECFYSKNYNQDKAQGSEMGSRFSRGGTGRGRGSYTRGLGRSRGNPRDSQGVVLRCYECESTMHLVSKCPHRQFKTENASVTVQLTLVAGLASKEQDLMLYESLARAIIDCGCTKTVAGETWVQEYLSLLSEEERKKVEMTAKQSSTLYRFGDGRETKSMKELVIPMFICGKKTNLNVEVVDNNIPLLLGRPSMTQLGMILNTKNHSVNVDGRNFKVGISSTGHYILPVSEFTYEGTEIVLSMENLSTYTKKVKKQKAEKLHRQFAHASKERLFRLLKDSGCQDKEFFKILEDCCRDCQFCQKYRHAKPKPVVGLPKGDRFNQVVSMDLKEIQKGKIWILHLVDNATRYTAATLIYSKKKDVIVKKIFQIWLSYFGSPEKFHSDCGGEFVNEVFTEMAEMFGVKISTTPGESPFSNGIVERGNAMLYETMMKTKEDSNCSLDTALAWAVCAKNCLQNVSGYSPNQLVFGKNVNLPSVAHDTLPALEEPTHSELVRENLNAMHKARENFIKSEASEKIKRALKHNVRTYSEVIFHPGEEVYYKNRNDKKWKGPAKVLGKESNFVLIRNGASYFRCHPCNLIKVNPKENKCNEEYDDEYDTSFVSKKTDPKESVDCDDSNEKNVLDISSSEQSDEENSLSIHSISNESEAEDVNQDNDSCNEDSFVMNENDTAEIFENSSDQQSIDVIPNKSSQPKEPRALRALKDYNKRGLKEATLQNSRRQLDQDANTMPRSKTTIQYCLQDGTVARANVLSSHQRPDENCKMVHVQLVGQDSPSVVDWKTIKWWKEICETEHVYTLTAVQEYETDVVEAKERELKNLTENDVFEYVDDKGQKAVSCRWVFTEKHNPDGSKLLKARLVARGFEEKLIDRRVDSPTCSRQSLRLVLITASTMNWEIHVLDISSAFLQGNRLSRTVYVRPPKGVCKEGKMWCLKRCLYGLADAPREWYDRVCQEMKKMGATVSLYDKSLFMWHEDSRLVGLLISHVDDFEYCGTFNWQKEVIGNLTDIFKISKKEKGSFKYVGLNIEQGEKQIFVDQLPYCNDLKEITLSAERKKQMDEPLTEEEKKKLRSICGQVLWVTSQTRPDSAFNGCIISNSGNDPKVKSLVEANRTVRKLKSDHLKIVYPCLGKPEKMKVVVYGDGSHASLPSGASQGGSISFLVGENGKAAPISWKSKRLDRITKSPLATEISAVADAADYGHLVASMVQEIFCLKEIPVIELMTDSFSLKEHLVSKKIISDPRLRVDIARLREMSELGEVLFKWVPSEQQLADCLTKKGASTDMLRKALASGVLPGHQLSQM